MQIDTESFYPLHLNKIEKDWKIEKDRKIEKDIGINKISQKKKIFDQTLIKLKNHKV